MTKSFQNFKIATCLCGQVELKLKGHPIISVVCYCDDCQNGALIIEALPNSLKIEDRFGGTPYVLYKKNLIECSKGTQYLKNIKLKKKSPTNRVIATCCNSLMFIKFDDGKHWIDIYTPRIKGHHPPAEMRICTKYRTNTELLPNDLPSFPKFPLRFKLKLAIARFFNPKES